MGASGRDDERADVEPRRRSLPHGRPITAAATAKGSPVESPISRARFDLALARLALDDALGALPHFEGGEAIATRALLDLMGELITAKHHLTDLEARSLARA